MNDSPARLTTRKQQLLGYLKRHGDVTAREVAEALGWSSSDASAHLCKLRARGLVRVVGRVASPRGGRRINLWRAIPDAVPVPDQPPTGANRMSGSNPIPIKRTYTTRSCMKCERSFRSAGNHHRICNYCKTWCTRADAEWVAYETSGAAT